MNERKYQVFLAIIIVFVFIQTFNNNNIAISVWDNLYHQFYGLSPSGYSIYTYLFFCFIFLGYPFLVQSELIELYNGKIFYILIRYGSYKSWFNSFLLKNIFYSIVFMLFLLSSMVVIGLISGLTLNLEFTLNPSIKVSYLIYHFLVNGSLQVLNYILYFYLMLSFSNKKETLLSLYAGIIILGLPVINQSLLIPIALNSLGYLSPNLTSVLKISLTLICYLTVILTIIYFLIKKNNLTMIKE